MEEKSIGCMDILTVSLQEAEVVTINAVEFEKHIKELRAIAEEINHSSLRDTINALADAARH